ncbi:MAG: hypothetical protein AB4426_28680 [Xenococcaceae cyanobacterium]
MIQYMSQDLSNKPGTRQFTTPVGFKPWSVEFEQSKVNPSNGNQGFGQYLDLILFTVACAYLLGVILWLVSQEKLKLPLIFKSVGETVLQENQLSSSDAQFIAYMLRSLEMIDSKAQANKQQTTVSSTKSAVNLSSVLIPGNPASVAPEAPTVIARTHIPVNQSSQSTAAAVAPLSVPIPPPPPSSSHPLQLSTVPVLAPKTNLPPSPALSPTISHTLVGLLESGDHSAALFQINDITKRIQIGEGIDASGWTLVSVANKQAVIYRNGQVRSISVGQKF